MSQHDYQFLCTIAGSDPTGGAGLQADLKTFAAHGAIGTAVVTAVTVQDREGVHEVSPVAPDIVAAQIGAVRRTREPSGIKTGMLWSAALIEAVAGALDGYDGPLVVDPVLVATAGGALLEAEALPAMRDVLLPRARIATPNLPEAAALLGVPSIDAGSEADAARALVALGPEAVLLKGGHAEGGDEAVDWLATASGVEALRLPWVEGASGHGTGCTLASALAARLALGDRVPDAAWTAKRYVHRALVGGAAIGDGWMLDHRPNAD
ncbi:MAG: bifunctional hydroxymethylpyrimidine kinase/phosphomethylpyrimidine kinase [Planctomycetota bacterium]|nr:bifunctional hydroxymethylpyrimidine kinase/phosphomethylpyrimidine kinase [Planctomycetota bacterium]